MYNFRILPKIPVNHIILYIKNNIGESLSSNETIENIHLDQKEQLRNTKILNNVYQKKMNHILNVRLYSLIY